MRGEDLDPLDRVDAQVGVELHAGLEDLGGVAGLLRDHLHQRRVHRGGPAGGRHRGIGDDRRSGEELDDLPEGADGAEVLRADHRAGGQSVLERGEDLDPLDRVDAQVGVELHAGLEDLGGVAGLLRDHLHQRRVDGRCGRPVGRDRRRGRDRRGGRARDGPGRQGRLRRGRGRGRGGRAAGSAGTSNLGAGAGRGARAIGRGSGRAGDGARAGAEGHGRGRGSPAPAAGAGRGGSGRSAVARSWPSRYWR